MVSAEVKADAEKLPVSSSAAEITAEQAARSHDLLREFLEPVELVFIILWLL